MISLRIAPSTVAAAMVLSAAKNVYMPGWAPVLALIASSSAGVRNFAIGVSGPAAVHLIQARPFAPYTLARSVSLSISEREKSDAQEIARTTPPAAMAPPNTLNPQ